MSSILLLALQSTLPAALAEEISLPTQDGLTLSAEYHEGSKERGILFIHQEKGKHSDWRFFAEKMQRSDFSTLCLDLRGHGRSAPDGTSYNDLEDEDYPKMVQDVSAALDFMQEEGIEEISIVAASLGANLSLLAAQDRPEIINMVLLSPGLNIKGVQIKDAVSGYGKRTLLIVASNEDAYYAKSAGVFQGQAKGDFHLEMLRGAGHGSRMLNKDPDLEPMVQNWLLRPPSAAQETGETEINLNIDVPMGGELESEGILLPSHQ